jgi:AcrR family transcriptional regulator
VPPRIRTKPRKKPTQARSQETVEAILTAATRVLVKDGYDATTTNKIAARAGVSIGSLYQYFPSKESIVAALVERHREEMREVISKRLGEHQGHSIRENVRAILEAIVEVKRLDPKLHRVFVEQVPRIGELPGVFDVNQQLATLITLILQSRPEKLRPKNLDLASYVLVHTVLAVTHAVLVERPENLVDGSLVDELTDLTEAYLVGRPD